MVCISAFTVSSTPRGFKRCEWPVNTKARAIQLAQELSYKHAIDPDYPNAFYVQDGDKTLCKFFQGVRFERFETI